jgi:hypothetical protein
MPHHVGLSDGECGRQRTANTRIATTLLIIAAFWLGSPLLTWAHLDQPSPYSWDQPWQQMWQVMEPSRPPALAASLAMIEAPLAFVIFAVVAVGMAHGLWRWRRATALGLVLVLGTFILGMAVHSVHHLSDPAKAAECLVFLASQHASGTLAEPSDVFAPMLTISTAASGPSDAPPLALSFRPALPRAPPSFPV